jgi:hypothetical protein
MRYPTAATATVTALLGKRPIALIAVLHQHSPELSHSFAAVTWPYLMRSLPLRCSKRAGIDG